MRKSKKLYNSYVCPNCFYQINKCTCSTYPPYHLIMIDENIQEHIRVLNEKGYGTRVCCEGHHAADEIYIGFNDAYDEIFNTPLPDGFINDKNRYIRCRIPRDCDDVEGFKCKQLSKLMEWIEKLPSRQRIR